MHGRSLPLSYPRRTDCLSATLSPLACAAESLHKMAVRGLGRAVWDLVTHRATRAQGAATKAAGQDRVAESWDYDVSCAALIHASASPGVPATRAPGLSVLPCSVPY